MADTKLVNKVEKVTSGAGRKEDKKAAGEKGAGGDKESADKGKKAEKLEAKEPPKGLSSVCVAFSHSSFTLSRFPPVTSHAYNLHKYNTGWVASLRKRC